MNKKRIYQFLLMFILIFVSTISGCKDKSVNSDTSQYTREQLDRLTLASLNKIDDYPLYVMTYYGDYGFSEYLKTGNVGSYSSTENVNAVEYSWCCTCFAAMGNEGSPVFGRNFDWHDCIPLLLFTNPPDAFKSVSVVDLEYLGYDRHNLPDARQNTEGLLNTPWLPFDGMNEKGVAIGMMAIPHAEAPYSPSKITIDEIQLIRLVLDYAENVDHAVSLIQNYNIRMMEPPIHYLVADTSGRSAIIEFVEGEMIVIGNDEPWQVSTNFIVHDSGVPNYTGCWRYNTAFDYLENVDGQVVNGAAMNLLQQVSQWNTIWSIVYEMNSGGIHVAVGRKYAETKRFTLE